MGPELFNNLANILDEGREHFLTKCSDETNFWRDRNVGIGSVVGDKLKTQKYLDGRE